MASPLSHQEITSSSVILSVDELLSFEAQEITSNTNPDNPVALRRSSKKRSKTKTYTELIYRTEP